MAIERMSVPLGVKSKKPARKKEGVGYRRIAIALACAGIAGFLGIMSMRNRSLGGDIVAVATIDRSAVMAGTERNDDRLGGRRIENQTADPAARRNASEVEAESGVIVNRQQGGQVPGATIIQVPMDPKGDERLVAAPDPRITERAAVGLLPRAGEGGLVPRRVYARPAPKEAGPRIAVVLTGMGVNARGTVDAISRLSGEVTLAFAPYGRDLEAQVQRARRDGHEILLQIPMEPQDYPENDPGPHTLRTGAKPKENADRLAWLMSRFPGYVGLMNFQGSKLLNTQGDLDPLLSEMSRRGLMFLDDGSTPRNRLFEGAAKVQLPLLRADRLVESVGTGINAKIALGEAETLAQRTGRAVVVLPALPANIELVSAWQDDVRRRGFVLAPVSSMLAPPRAQ